MNTWLLRFSVPASPLLRLVCLPGAGSSPAMFHPWSAELGPDVEVCAVVPPGRGHRVHEEPLTRMGPYVDGVVSALTAERPLPVVLFGHSLGSLIAYEVAQRVRDMPGIDLRALVVAAHRAPRTGSARADPDGLSDAGIADLLEWPPLPDGVAPDSELRQLVVPAARADFELDFHYRCADREPLGTPVHAHGGDADPTVSPDEMRAWRPYTDGEFRFRSHPGGHFFLTDEGRESFLDELRPLLRHLKGELDVRR